MPIEATAVAGPRGVAACIFLRRDEERFAGLRRLSPGSAAARLMANALNPLAHPGDGLDAAVGLSQRVDCFEIDILDLVTASGLIEASLRLA